MRITRLLFVACLAIMVLAPSFVSAQSINTPRGVVAVHTDQTAVADGTYQVYIDLRYFKRADIRVVQDGGSGTIQFQTYASWDPGDDLWTAASTLDYDDIGLDIYLDAVFSDAIERLLDAGQNLEGATWLRLTFTVAGASADASYKVIRAQTKPKV